jgi:hypothetical protein
MTTEPGNERWVITHVPTWAKRWAERRDFALTRIRVPGSSGYVRVVRPALLLSGVRRPS